MRDYVNPGLLSELIIGIPYKFSEIVLIIYHQDNLCNDYIMAMLPFEDRIYLCGTGKAPSAACS